MRYILLSFFLTLSIISFTQEIPVTIKIVNTKKEAVAYSNISVNNRTDSLQTNIRMADSLGRCRINLTKNNQYIIKVSSVGYLPQEKKITFNGNQTFFIFTLEAEGKTLEAAVVISRKPLIKQEDDKTIIDPENLVEASTNGYEVIEKTPGLFVDQDGNIYISSLTPATVQINGRDMRMSSADIATMLKSLPPNSISKIEVVRTPSAKYDAAGGGGVVNVVLKKGIKIGMTGSFNTGLQQGTFNNQFAGFNLNNNDGEKSYYINLNYNRRNNSETIITDRIFAVDSMLSQDAYTKYQSDAYFVGYGINIFKSKKWDFEFSGNINLNKSDNQTDNLNLIKKISASQIITSSPNTINNKGTSLVIGNGFETKYKIDTLGSDWTNNVFYYNSHNSSEQSYSAIFQTLPAITKKGDGTGDNKRNFFSAKSDLKLKLKYRITFETGIKTTIHNYQNKTNYFLETGTVRVKDSSRTNTYDYKENINSFYLQVSKTLWKNFVVKSGARLENTNMIGEQTVPYDTSFTLKRTDLFPYVFLSKNLMKIAGFDLKAYLVYRRTISRPVYEQLNPFPKYVDEFLTEIGNPSLKPQFTKNYEANISVDERPILAVGLNDTKDIFSMVTYQADTGRKQALRTYDNLGTNKEWYFRGIGAIPPGGRYFFVIGGQYNYNIYDGLYGGQPLSFKKGTWTFFTYQTLKIDKRSVFTINGFVRLKGQQQLYEIDPFGMLNSSVNRKFLKDKLVVTLSMNDMFFTNKINFSLNQGDISVSGKRFGDSRRFGLNIRYNFGIRKKEENSNMFNSEIPNSNN